jgi:hypothetical protein
MNIVRCQLKPDSIDPIDGVDALHPTDGQPCIMFDVPDSVPNKNGCWLWIEWPKQFGLAPIAQHGLLDMITAGGGGLEFDIFRGQKAASVRPFRLDGHFCRWVDDGTEMLINMATGFRLGERFAHDLPAADRFCQSLVDNGLNSARIALMQDTRLYLPDPALQYRIHPNDFGSLDSWQLWVQDLTDYLGGWGIIPSYVLCTQTQTLMPDPVQQRAYIQATMEALTSRYLLMALVNEHGIYDNSVDGSVLLMQKPAGSNFLLSTGSLDSSNRSPFLPLHDVIEEHFNDANEWQRKSKDVMDDGNSLDRAGYVSETTRTDKEDAGAGRQRALWHYEDNADVATSMTLAALIHTPEGKNADPFGFSVPFIGAHNRGIAKGGIAYRRGRYSRTDPSPAGLTRQYNMTVDGVGTHPIPVRM